MRIPRHSAVAALLLFAVSITVDAQIEHHHGYIKFCNSGSTDLAFNLITREGMNILSDHWYANGRFRVDRHSCEYLAEDVSVAMQMYVGVRRIVQSGDNPDVFFTPKDLSIDTRIVDEEFCTKREKFSRTATFRGHTQCPPGYSLQPFRLLIILPPLINFTFTVGEKSRSKSGTPKQNASQPGDDQGGKRAKTDEDCWYVADDEDPECEALRARERDAANLAKVGPVNYAEGDYVLVETATPVYPPRMLSGGIPGFVDVSFTITATGAVINPLAIYSTSPQFVSAATAAVLKYKYKPRVVDGRPQEVKGVTVRIEFEITE